MQKIFRFSTALARVCAVFFLGVVLAHADEPVTKKHSRHQQMAAKASPTTEKGGHLIPTRDDRHAQEVEGHDAGGADGPEYRVTTGSMIPQRYNRRGYGTDSQDNLFIYDQNDIRLRSSENVSDSLRSVPGLSIGRR